MKVLDARVANRVSVTAPLQFPKQHLHATSYVIVLKPSTTFKEQRTLCICSMLSTWRHALKSSRCIATRHQSTLSPHAVFSNSQSADFLAAAIDSTSVPKLQGVPEVTDLHTFSI